MAARLPGAHVALPGLRGCLTTNLVELVVLQCRRVRGTAAGRSRMGLRYGDLVNTVLERKPIPGVRVNVVEVTAKSTVACGISP